MSPALVEVSRSGKVRSVHDSEVQPRFSVSTALGSTIRTDSPGQQVPSIYIGIVWSRLRGFPPGSGPRFPGSVGRRSGTKKAGVENTGLCLFGSPGQARIADLVINSSRYSVL